MNDSLNTIVEGRVCEGILFATPRDRGLYIGTLIRNRQRWLKENAGRWRYIKDIQREAASRASAETEVNVVAAASGPNSQTSSYDLGKDGNAEETDSSADAIARGSPPAEQASATTALSLSEIAKNEIAIDGHVHVSTQRLASMLGISERTLSRLLRNGDRPPHVKIGGSYYYRLDKIQEWAVAKGITAEDAIGYQ
jgi:AraC-like DNA-binding protein